MFGHNLAFAYATDPFISHYRLTEKEYNKKDADILKKIIKQKLRGYLHSPRYVDKSQTYTLKIPFLKKCFPDAKFVLVSRNPYAICRGRIISDSKEDLKARYNHCVNTFSIATKDLSEIDHFVLRIEDFIENPSLIIVSLLSSLELPKQDNLLSAPNQKIPIGGVSKEK